MRKMKHYNTIQEFQDEFPNKRKREAFAATLSNEEIDELIELCDTPQGKIYYQRMKKSETVFAFELKDAWGELYSRLTIQNGPDGAYVHYYAGNEGRCFIPETEIKNFRLRMEDLKAIREILDDDRLFETEELEPPYGMMFFDGCMQRFEISSFGRHIVSTGGNIQHCKDDTEHCPHSVLMAGTLEKLREILLPLGVPEECMMLKR